MKKTYLIQGVLLLFLAFQFNSCSDEPLEGEFLENEGPSGVGEGEFKASIAGQSFTADVAAAVLSGSNDLMISGSKISGEHISLKVANAEEGDFVLTWDGENQNIATYADGNPGNEPYVTDGEDGGSGEMKITKMDTVAKIITGTFSFTGVRTKLDSAGNPVLDGDGNSVMENIEITNGVFNSIDLMTMGSGGL